MKKLYLLAAGFMLYGSSIYANSIIQFQPGWNLIGTKGENVDAECLLDKLPSKSIIWGFDNVNKTWSMVTNDQNLNDSIGYKYPKLNRLVADRGYWVLNTEQYAISIDISSCNKQATAPQVPQPSPTTQVTLSTFTPNDGRMLAAVNCFGCHGSNGYSKTSWDSIAGEDMEEFFESDHPIMKAQTYGFTQTEIGKIFGYLSTLKEKESSDEYEYDKEDDD